MMSEIKKSTKKLIPDVRPGDTVKVYQIIKETGQPKGKAKKEEKEKIQIFEGLVLARKHGSEPGATITVRKVVDGIGVEKIFPLHSPMIKKIEIVKRGKVRRAKLYYLRKAKGKRARLKNLEFSPDTFKEAGKEFQKAEEGNSKEEIIGEGAKKNEEKKQEEKEAKIKSDSGSEENQKTKSLPEKSSKN